MSHFLIYLPKVQGQSPALLEAAGLGDFVAGAEFFHSKGPDNGHGVMCAWRKPGGDPRINFDAPNQTWVPQAVQPGVDPRYYVGFWNDLKPEPGDLMRPYPYRGAQFTLGDGQEWLFPFARELPRDLVLADDGSWRFEVQRRFHAFWVESTVWVAKMADWKADGDRVRAQFTFGDTASFLIRSLRLNYRILPEVASRLRLFDTLNMGPPMLAVIASIESR